MFTRILVPALTRPGHDLAALAIGVREEVARIAQTAGPAADDAAWSFVKDTRDVELLRRFIAQFPTSPRRREAEERLKAPAQTNVAVTLPVRPKPAEADPCSEPVTVSFASRCAAPLTAAQERG